MSKEAPVLKITPDTSKERYLSMVEEMLGGLFGVYFRDHSIIYVINGHGDPDARVLALLNHANMGLSEFQDLHRQGLADIRFFACNLDDVNKNIHLGGNFVTYWGKENPKALENSVKTFQDIFPDINISSGPTIWKDLREA